MVPGALRRSPCCASSPRPRRPSRTRSPSAWPAPHLRRARHAPPARRDPEGPSARGPARPTRGPRTRPACSTPRTGGRSPTGPASPTRRATSGSARWPRTRSSGPDASRVALDRRRPRRRLRHAHRRLDRPGRGGARLARPRPRRAPRRPLAARPAQGRLRAGLARRQRRQPGPRPLPPARASRTTAGPATPAEARRRGRRVNGIRATSLSLAGCPPDPPGALPVAMRMSSLFLRTLRENPADAEVPSHQLLVRAGYIRRVSPGIYTWLPLGLKVLRRVETIVREEMDAIGAQELLFPALLPREPYEATGRWDEYGDNVFRLKDRKGADYLLGPDPRGDVHPRGQGPLQLLQGPAAVDLPDPDEVPRRGPAARGPAARARVRHEGQLLLRHRRGRARQELPAAPRRLRADLRPARLPLRHRPGDGRRHGRLEVGGVPRDRRERRGHLRALHQLRVRRQRRGRARPVPDAVDASGVPAAHVEDTPDTPTIDTLVAHLNEAFPRATAGPGPPPTR